MISSSPTAAAMEVRPCRRDSGTALRGKPVSMADLWSLMMSEVSLMSSLKGGEGRVEKASGTLTKCKQKSNASLPRVNQQRGLQVT